MTPATGIATGKILGLHSNSQMLTEDCGKRKKKKSVCSSVPNRLGTHSNFLLGRNKDFQNGSPLIPKHK